MKAVGLWDIFVVFLRIGALSFGGGLSGWVYREIVQLRPWFKEEEFLAGLALSQILPGANVTNLTVYVGQRLRGTLGALAGLLGLLLVPFLAGIGLLLAYDAISGIAWIDSATNGIAAAAVGLLMFTTWKASRVSARTLHGVTTAIATFMAIAVFHWPLLLSVLCIAPLSVLAAWKVRSK
jgi:chromate transporter